MMRRSMQGYKVEFMKIIRELCYSRQIWEVWSDVIAAMACSIANSVDRSPKRHEDREKEYASCIKRLGGVEKPAQLLSILVAAMEMNPDQDFLGELYMALELGNHWKGQFFTPYSLCELMSRITIKEVDGRIEREGYISICDPSCGAGATLIAAVHTMKRSKYNFQNHVLFAGQDIDRITGMMCYIQLSLLGCAGYICIGNTLSNPMTGHVLFPREKEGQELWYMPMFFSDIWHWRRMFYSLERLGGTVTTEKTVEKERYFMFFDFRGQEVQYGNQWD